MKRVVKITDTEMVLDDGSVVNLLFELDRPLTLEEAQEVYENSVKAMNILTKGKYETAND